MVKYWRLAFVSFVLTTILVCQIQGNRIYEVSMAYHTWLSYGLQAQACPIIDIVKIVPQSHVPGLVRASWTFDEYSESNLGRITPFLF
jgi:hypothetical protein